MLKRILVVLLTAAMSAAPVCAEEVPPVPADDVPTVPAETTPAGPAKEVRPGQGEEVRFSVGLGESLGIAGIVSARSTTRSQRCVSGCGSTMLIINGVGVGWQHRFWDRVITPFVNGTGFAMIGLPAMCSGSHCRIKVPPPERLGRTRIPNHFSGRRPHLQVGLSTMFIYDFYNLGVVESPHTSPHVWPVLNVGWTRQF